MTRDLQTLRARYSINNFGTNSRLWDDLQFLLTSLTEMEERVKDDSVNLERMSKRLQFYIDKCDQAEARLAELQDKLTQANIERQIFERASLDGDVKIKELQTELKLNVSMLAKQCDLAREAETSVKELETKREVKFIQGRADQMVYDAELVDQYRKRAEEAEFRLKRLQEAVDRHRKVKLDYISDLDEMLQEDEELYKVRDGVEG